MSGGEAMPRGRRALLFLPLGLAAGAGIGFWAMLRGLRDGSYNPTGVPSALIGKPAPGFTLTPVEGVELPPFPAEALRGLERPVLVNFWASWCVPCVIEHPQLMQLQREGVPVFGINYKDKPADAASFLRRHGNPFARLGADGTGRVGIDWGVYGVPETYLIDRGGIIRWRWAGPITPEVVAQDLHPLLRRHA
ncbi:DsbE family thiol:disulfide interchange protein [Roseomonas sp. OT10]|uniref:DsbE family thiol:disulfide interchange protein n=1 Tax=Roseomonas cutis TaxID=2897332 RepID=UPI001E56E5BA|nr:DsbE family thiol:disulfide interchange protein [Roseomonas sp. OT10]UFN48071.1 DsbE family thiol:disulfide interchange protein [Roseomonas sp. OT10]